MWAKFKVGFRLLGVLWAIGLMSLMAYTWLRAALSPTRTLVVSVDDYNEMAVEWFVVPTTWAVVVLVCAGLAWAEWKKLL